MSEFTSERAGKLPSTKIIMRCRTGLKTFVNTDSTSFSGEVDSSLSEYLGVRMSPFYSPDGSILCLVKEPGSPIILKDTSISSSEGWTREIACGDPHMVEFSPQGSFLITWSRPQKGTADTNPESNLCIWSIATGELVQAFFQKTLKKGIIQWTEDERYCFRIASNVIHIFHGHNIKAGVLVRIRQMGMTSFKVTPTCPPSVAVFMPEIKGKAAMVSVYSCPDLPPDDGKGRKSPETEETHVPELVNPGVTRSLMAASEASMLWNRKGNVCLIHTHSDVDTTNTSYYGATGEYVRIHILTLSILCSLFFYLFFSSLCNWCS